jgi:hypothetical protein
MWVRCGIARVGHPSTSTCPSCPAQIFSDTFTRINSYISLINLFIPPFVRTSNIYPHRLRKRTSTAWGARGVLGRRASPSRSLGARTSGASSRCVAFVFILCCVVLFCGIDWVCVCFMWFCSLSVLSVKWGVGGMAGLSRSLGSIHQTPPTPPSPTPQPKTTKQQKRHQPDTPIP